MSSRGALSPSWLVTGGCGFIGSNLIEVLLHLDPQVGIRVLDNESVGKEEDLAEVTAFRKVSALSLQGAPKGVELVVGDVRDRATCAACCRGVGVVVHLAASTGVPQSIENPAFDLESNVVGTFNMLEGARQKGVKKFILASSNAAVGEVAPPVDEQKAPRPISPYGASKLSAEAYCFAYSNSLSLPTVALRFGNVYGPRSLAKGSVVAHFLKRAFQGLPLEVHGDGQQTRDFIFVRDLVDAIVRAASSDVAGEVFQIANFTETTIQEVAELVRELFQEELARDLTIVSAPARRGDIRRNFSDIRKARELLGYTPQWKLKEGLRETLLYFRRAWEKRSGRMRW